MAFYLGVALAGLALAVLCALVFAVTLDPDDVFSD